MQSGCRLPFLTGRMTQITVSFQSQTYWLSAFTRPWDSQHLQAAAQNGAAAQGAAPHKPQPHTLVLCAASRDQMLPGIFFPADTKTLCNSLQHLAPALARAVRTPTQGATGPAFPVLSPSSG